MEEGKKGENKTGRAEVKASQIITINPKAATKEIIDPIEDTMFHVVYASG